MTELETILQQLPEAEAPVHLARDVSVRIAQLAEPGIPGAAGRPARPAREGARAWLAWATAAAGAVIGLGAQLYRLWLGEASLNLTGARITGGLLGPLADMPVTPAAAVLALALALYLTGLLAPLRGRRSG
jgi:hypothetical protein